MGSSDRERVSSLLTINGIKDLGATERCEPRPACLSVPSTLRKLRSRRTCGISPKVECDFLLSSGQEDAPLTRLLDGAC